MDTSDSEHFESADEDIQSDDEINQDIKLINKSKVISDSKENKENIKADNLNIESVEIKEEVQCAEPKNIIEEVPEPSTKKEFKEIKDEEIIVTESSSKKNKLNAKSKLGSKIDKGTVNFEKTPEKTSRISEKLEKKQVEKVVEDENLWEDDEIDWGVEEEKSSKVKETPKVQSRIDYRPQENSNSQSDNWGGWGNWGVSVLSTATQSVTSITSQLTNVIESGLGAVDPEELARIDREEKKKLKEELGDNFETNSTSGFGLGNLVKLVENTGTKVISGGLDTLETIGKKTMAVLQEGDPGLKKKRAFLKIDQDKPVLSQILREAKEKADKEEIPTKKKTKNYEILFDDHHGLVHLEALELLSKQCEIKLKNIQNSLSGTQYIEYLETLDQIKELCELPDEEDEEQISLKEIKEKLEKAVKEMDVQVNFDKLIKNWEESEIWLSTISEDSEIHHQAIETLAKITSLAMEQYHKIGEFILIKDHQSTADEADGLVQITTTLISLISMIAAKFSEKLNGKTSNSVNKEISDLITNVFFEAANSSSYIQDALQLLIPVLQVGAKIHVIF